MGKEPELACEVDQYQLYSSWAHLYGECLGAVEDGWMDLPQLLLNSVKSLAIQKKDLFRMTLLCHRSCKNISKLFKYRTENPKHTGNGLRVLFIRLLKENMLRIGPPPFLSSGCCFGSDGGFMVINLPACSQCQSRKRDAVLQLTELRITDNYIHHKRFSSCESS